MAITSPIDAMLRADREFTGEMPPTKDQPFPPHERQTAVHERWVGLLKARLAQLRIENDSTKTMEETARTRGRIVEVKELLAMAAADFT